MLWQFMLWTEPAEVTYLDVDRGAFNLYGKKLGIVAEFGTVELSSGTTASTVHLVLGIADSIFSSSRDAIEITADDGLKTALSTLAKFAVDDSMVVDSDLVTASVLLRTTDNLDDCFGNSLFFGLALEEIAALNRDLDMVLEADVCYLISSKFSDLERDELRRWVKENR